MKRLLSVLIVLAVLAIVAPATASAQCGSLRHRHGNYTHRHRSCVGDRHKHGRSFWQKHRDKLTTAGGAGAGALIGGVAGGKKGALIGAAIGGGSAAIWDQVTRRQH
jgi:hypothetical protein